MNHLLAIAAAALLIIMIMVAAKISHGRKMPAPQQPPKPEGWDDRGYAAAHGIPLNIWVTIPPERKRELRLSAAHGLGRTRGSGR